MSAPKGIAYLLNTHYKYKSLIQITFTNKYVAIIYAVTSTSCSHFLLLISKQAIAS